MATKGFSVIARRLPCFNSSLRPALPFTSLLPHSKAGKVSVLLPRPWSSAFASPFGHGHQDSLLAMVCLRHFSASSRSQDKASSQEKPSAESSDQGGKALTFRNIMINFATAPKLPTFLGVMGAIPFLALTPPFPSFLPLPEVLAANPIETQTFYGAVILSFLGGPHWGLAMVGIHASPNHKIFNYASNSVRYVWSVVPPLLAWPSLFMSMVPKLQFLICSFFLVLGVDIMFAGIGLLPPWYLPLRLLLSGVVLLCLSASLLEVIITQKLEERQSKRAAD